MEVSLVFPHQLYAHSPALSHQRPVYLLEEKHYFGEYNGEGSHFHKQKLVLHRASMKAYERLLKKHGFVVHYLEHRHGQSFGQTMEDLFHGESIVAHCCDPTDHFLLDELEAWGKSTASEIHYYETPNFVCQQPWLSEFFEHGHDLQMSSFYKAQRRRLGVMVHRDGKPYGGKWSFDESFESQQLTHEVELAEPCASEADEVAEATAYVEKKFPHARGQLDGGFHYPHSRRGALLWLKQFFEERLLDGGAELASKNRNKQIVYHSVLTPMLNIGLLQPEEVLHVLMRFSKLHKVPVHYVESFVRQIIGWREFVRGVYLYHGRSERMGNFWKLERRMPDCFYTAETGVDPVDESIRKVLATGYCHQMERMMVQGSFMLLCRIHPDEVHKWFMEMMVDGFDWVVVPNVYGISQFADGGLFVNRPYLVSSRTIQEQLGVAHGKWSQLWDALLWAFIDDYHDEFMDNPQLSSMAEMLTHMPDRIKKPQLKMARNFLAQLS